MVFGICGSEKNLTKNSEMGTTTINGPRGKFNLFQSAKSQRRYLLIRLESNTSYSTYIGSFGFD